MAEQDGKELGIQQRIKNAVVFRLQHFKDQADSLTMESVRRLLEKDLGLDKFSMDAHKRFIRDYLEKKMEDADDCTSEDSTDNLDKDVNTSEPEAPIMPEQQETKKGPKKSSNKDGDMAEDSPIMGVLTPKPEDSVSESMIEKAIMQKADHFRANSSELSLAGVRRLLEDDLGLDKYTLDPFKKFIGQLIDQVINPPDEEEKGSDSSGSKSDEIEDKVKSRKEAAPRRKNNITKEPTKRKRSKESDLNLSGKKENKRVKRQKEEDADSDDHGSASEDGQSESSIEKSAQRKDKPAPPVHGKQVEHLKSIIKACGMSVAPTIYKKAKQVPDSKREAFLVKELEAILSREGLSRNPTEKEIKDCKKKKQTARELEGIDMTNIISNTRRRSAFSFANPPKPEVRVKVDKVAKKISTNKKNNEDNAEEDEDEDEDVEKEDVDEEKKGEEKKEKIKEDEEGEEEEEEDDEDDSEEEEDEDDSEEEFNIDDDEESD